MLMERRGQQDLNFTENTTSICNNGIRGQKGLTARAEEPSWKVRISLRGQKRNLPFSNLMKHLNYETLHEAFKALNGKKALGVDGVSKSVYAENLEENLLNLADRIQRGTYRPQAKREVLIPKPNGKTRPIAIASFEDKLVDWVVGEILTQIYDPLFIKNSFGYRPGKSAEGAIRACYNSMEKNKRPFVLEIDFSSFFDLSY